MKNISIRSVLFLALTLFVGNFTLTAAKPISTTFFGSKAVGGYDVVAYHTLKKAVKGQSKYQVRWKGVNWLFSSASHREAFQKNPAEYAPAYGGYCAWAAADNKLVKADPTIFDSYQGRLFLNYNQTTKSEWNADREGMVTRGDKNYPRLIEE